ncbi:uncharacterized protein LOC109848437 isoform X2 [Asparagus officinalis]|uniref:uncharacterized protein LOC109848437 isoform X2 n=1 Tax=Asparagus officinalis TaxID=4686 RepID=UPI00098E6E50|nr:uncharacterized protein LOC109848437 isoform X2 [Asparagus officinalis]
MGRGSRNDPARRYADSVSTSQQHQPEMHDHMDQASLLRQQQILKAQSLQSGSDMRCVSLKAFYLPFYGELQGEMAMTSMAWVCTLARKIVQGKAFMVNHLNLNIKKCHVSILVWVSQLLMRGGTIKVLTVENLKGMRSAAGLIREKEREREREHQRASNDRRERSLSRSTRDHRGPSLLKDERTFVMPCHIGPHLARFHLIKLPHVERLYIGIIHLLKKRRKNIYARFTHFVWSM